MGLSILKRQGWVSKLGSITELYTERNTFIGNYGWKVLCVWGGGGGTPFLHKVGSDKTNGNLKPSFMNNTVKNPPFLE